MILLLALLQDWEIGVGARSGDGPASTIESIEGGLSFRGDAKTRVWRIATRAVEAEPGACLRLDFESRTEGVRREDGQFGDLYVAIAFLDSARKTLDVRIRSIFGSEWEPDLLVARAPERTASAEIRIFLSLTGTFEVREVRVARVAPEKSFDLLVEEMDRHYAHFEVRRVDWRALTGRYRKRAEAAKSPEEFAKVVKEMLAELADPHVWIQLPGKPHEDTCATKPVPNVDFRIVAKQLKDLKQIGKIAITGRTSDGFGYAALGSLQSDLADFEAELENLFDAPGIIFDLRTNHGGDEMRGKRIASMFADQRRVYAKHRFRRGAGFADPMERVFEPREGPRYTKPVIVLTGPVCVSSGEGLVLMMKSLPHVTLVGRPTRGASGNPAPVELPNGVTVWYSRWLASLPDGALFETTGIAPDVDVKHVDGRDPAFDEAVRRLRGK